MPAPEPVAQPRRHPAFSPVSVPESGCASGSGSTGGAPAPAVSMRDLLAASRWPGGRKVARGRPRVRRGVGDTR
ncbi:hypothetical protein [Streptomyces galbus]|uniref:Uncharacterized protein n=1 Tax=Streptomyces galbus TaxID=33898 RepID=A0ABX1IBL5_STRGB|nr:hypothetical protein [Streptomyces galbus]NKQ23068.1 hypothetical protein [Streptomyces galbus]